MDALSAVHSGLSVGGLGCVPAPLIEMQAQCPEAPRGLLPVVLACRLPCHRRLQMNRITACQAALSSCTCGQPCSSCPTPVSHFQPRTRVVTIHYFLLALICVITNSASGSEMVVFLVLSPTATALPQVLVDQHGRGDAIQCAFPDQPCPPGSYKIMAFINPIPEDDPDANYCDHHFYVQHKDVHITLEPGDQLRDVAR